MIEIFKTNIEDQEQAHMLVNLIQNTFAGLRANFDLEDCDKILRVESQSNAIEINPMMALLRDFGIHAEVLLDVPSRKIDPPNHPPFTSAKLG